MDHVGSTLAAGMIVVGVLAAVTPAGAHVSTAVRGAYCEVRASACDQPAEQPAEPAPSDPQDRVLADLAEELGVPVEDLSVVETESVTWSDGSLGCGRPGGAYTQALVDGERMTVRVGERTYHFHRGGTGPFFHCSAPTQ